MVLGKVKLSHHSVSYENPMEVDISNEGNGNSSQSMENGHLEPVLQDSSGEGLPYAPENFPNEGDNWRWRVGKRVAITGHYLDRYIYPPEKYRHFEKGLSIKSGIGSKLSLKRFVETAFPKADVDAFFASFSWKVPSKKLKSGGSVERPIPFSLPHEETPKEAATDSTTVGCKAHNKMCSSLAVEDKPTVATMVCDICCREPRFCRDCYCILCCKKIDTAYEGYSYIKCEALVSKDCICGHIAHLECAIRAYMAGTVGGSIGLDAEYYCRRCDAKTELTPHVAKLLQTCKSIDSHDDLVKVLNVGVCVLRGSCKASAKSLLARLHRILTKVKNGSAFEDIWQEDNESAVISNGNYNTVGQEDEQPADSQEAATPSKSTVECQIQFLQLDNEIDKALQALKAAQESEYKIAEEGFRTQKDYLDNLYQQLEHETSELRKRRLSPDADELMDAVSERKDQIYREFKKLKQMKEATTKGFARTSKDILREHFGLDESD